MRCLLVGNYGVGNLGDEALREYFLQRFPDVEWQVLSAHPAPGEFARLPGGLRSFVGSDWLRTLKALKRADAVVFGGGSLFTDIESPYACFLWWVHAAMAKCYNKPIVLAFQGVGPFKTTIGEWFARRVLKNAAFTSVRDHDSYQLVKSWKLNTEVVQTFDPVFSLISAKKLTRNPQNVFIVIPRRNSGNSLQNALKNMLEQKKFDALTILLLQGDDPQEQEVSKIMQHNTSLPTRIVSVKSLETLIAGVGQAAHVLTERFHGGIAALALGVPLTVISQGEGDKLSQLQPYAEGKKSPHDLHALVAQGESALRKALVQLDKTR